LRPRPSDRAEDLPRHWGGYLAEFKLISLNKFTELEGNRESLRRNAIEVSPGQRRKFKIDISMHEYCAGKQRVDFEGGTIYVYSVEMIVAEKLRALCQQMDEYPLGGKTRSGRARDFFDIQQITTKRHIDYGTEDFHNLMRLVFQAKDVPLNLLTRIPDVGDFHSLDWPSGGYDGPSEDFEYYFDFMVTIILPKLKPLWNEDSP
jgi:hypothetical protein